jgi:hypothetical protein
VSEYAVPPGPLQETEYAYTPGPERLPVLTGLEPLEVRPPVLKPVPVHEVTLLPVQDMVAEPPSATDDGETEKLTDGIAALVEKLASELQLLP